ncbi:hypothetical protein HK102_003348 [Quaeritorhiza haematococci]|nr:hypothetical protein HK102_003348 [Quaeritorhiza haematococci]
MHHPDHRVKCAFGPTGAFQQCLECGWRNPIVGQLMIPSSEYPVLHQQFINIIINNTVNNYYKPKESKEIEVWDDKAHLHDDYQPFDDKVLNEAFKRAFSTGIDSDVGTLVALLNRERVVSSSEERTKWLKLKGFRWFPAELGDIKELMNPLTDGAFLHSKLREVYQHYYDNGNKKMAAKIQNIKNTIRQETFMTRVAAQTCARLLKEGYEEIVSNLDANKNLLGFNNGVYDLERGLFRDGRPNDYISKSVGYNYVPKDREHRAEVKDFFAQLFPDGELREYVFRYLSSCLLGYTHDQMIFFGFGSGRNGKSKLLALMKETLGQDYASTTDNGVVIGQQRSDSNAVTHALNMLKGKRFAYISETVEGSKINESAFKTMSGEDEMFSRELYKAGEATKPEFKLFLVCNHLPKFNATDRTMVRRIRVIPFQSQFVHPEELTGGDPNMFPINMTLNDEKLKSWRSSFMCLMLEWYSEYRRRGLADKPAKVAAMTRGYLSENDLYKGFLHMCWDPVPVEDETYWTPAFEFYQKFKTWCHENGFEEYARYNENKISRGFTGQDIDRQVVTKGGYRGTHIRGLRYKE